MSTTVLKFTCPLLLLLAGAHLASAQSANPLPFLTAAGTFQYVDAQSLLPVNHNSYAFAAPFADGKALVSDGSDQYYISPDGRIAGSRYTELSRMHNGFAIGRNGSGGIVVASVAGERPVSARVMAGTIADGMAGIYDSASGQIGFLNLQTNAIAVPCRYRAVHTFHNGLAGVLEKSGKWGCIDKAGSTMIPAAWEDIGVLSEGCIAARQDGRWGYINEKGATLIPYSFDRATAFSEGRAWVQRGKEWLAINTEGEVQTSMAAEMVTGPAEGTIAVMQGSVWGFADAKTGVLFVQPQYTRAGSFSNGLALVVKDGKKFYIDRSGRELRAR